MPSQDPSTPIGLLGGPYLDPAQGFIFSNQSISPQPSPILDRAGQRLSSASYSSHSSSGSLKGMAEEDESALIIENKKAVMNGNAVQVSQENNSNNGLKNGSAKAPTTPKKEPYKETTFPSTANNDSLLKECVSQLEVNEQNKLMNTVNQLSPSHATHGTSSMLLSPKSPVPTKSDKILSFESDDEEDKGDKDPKSDIYFEKDKKKDKRHRGSVIPAHIPKQTKLPRPSLPNIAIHMPSQGLSSPPVESSGNGTLKKKKFGLRTNKIRVTSVWLQLFISHCFFL